jgi:hypothetical protein
MRQADYADSWTGATVLVPEIDSSLTRRRPPGSRP